MKNALWLTVTLAISLAACQSIAANGVAAPINLAASAAKDPIVDDAGRISYIIDLIDHLQDSFPSEVTDEDIQRFGERPSGQAINMVKWFEEKYEFQHTDMTSWVGNSFTAFLAQGQVEALQNDVNVTLITENAFIELSVTPPPWIDTTHPPHMEIS